MSSNLPEAPSGQIKRPLFSLKQHGEPYKQLCLADYIDQIDHCLPIIPGLEDTILEGLSCISSLLAFSETQSKTKNATLSGSFSMGSSMLQLKMSQNSTFANRNKRKSRCRPYPESSPMEIGESPKKEHNQILTDVVKAISSVSAIETTRENTQKLLSLFDLEEK